MLRWLVRLLIFGAIAAVIAFVISRLRGSDDDWDDFDDDEAFEFQETPVEIDVPAQSSESDRMGNGAGDSVTAAGPRLTDIQGIGPAYEARLNAAGISSLEDLAGAEVANLSAQVDVAESLLTDWIDQARQMSSGGGAGAAGAQDGSSNGTSDGSAS